MSVEAAEEGVDVQHLVRENDQRRVSMEELDLIQDLGFGTYSVVKLARHKVSNRLYAVKIAERDPSSHGALRREWDVLRQASSLPGVVEAYGFERVGDTSTLVLEYMEGGELFERVLERERYTEYEARECAMVLLKIVRSLHAKRILHRDIKPENLLLVRNDSDALKLADFGSAMVIDDSSVITDAAGTELYVAPEILRLLYDNLGAEPRRQTTSSSQQQQQRSGDGEGKEEGYSYPHGFASDMWSCGVVIFVLLAGYPPFCNQEGKVDADVIDDIVNGRYDFYDEVWDDVTDTAKSLVCSLLQINPDKRLSATAALVHPWFSDDSLGTKVLSKTLANIQNRFKPKQRLKSRISAVMALNRARRLSSL